MNPATERAAAQVLVVEDERDIAALVAYHLTKEGYRVRTAGEGPDALEAMEHERPDLVVLDLMLPGVSGYELLGELKRRPELAEVPVIVLTARREEADRIKGLELGADDYVTKPFSPQELVLRVGAVLRRTQAPPVAGAGRMLRGGPVAVDLSAMHVAVDGEPVELTPTEYRLLVSLMERRGRVQSRRQLLQSAWDVHVDIETRTVDMHVQRLRAKLGAAGAWIETVRGFGYRFRGKSAEGMRSNGLGVRTLFLLASVGSGAIAVVLAYAAVGWVRNERLVRMVPADQVEPLLALLRGRILLGGIGALLLALLLGLGLAAAVVQPLRRLEAETLRWIRGARAPRASRSGVGEIDALARSIDLLAGELHVRCEGLARERDDMALLVDTVSEGILQLGPAGRVVRLNPAARALLGLPRDVEGQPIASLVRQGELRRMLERAVGGEPVPPGEVAIDERRVLVAVQPLGRAAGRPGALQAGAPGTDAAPGGGAVAAFMDLTELRRLEGVRRDFVANASHELKTPLTSIRGYAETLLADDLPPELRRKFLETVRQNAERLQRIIDDLLDLSRLESGGWRPELQDVDVAAVAEEAWKGLQVRAEAKRVAFSVVVGEASRATADPAGLRQVFSNLFDNALRHTDPGGRITVRLSTPADGVVDDGAGRAPSRIGRRWRDGGPAVALRRPLTRSIVIEVHDDGSGIPHDALDRIFERFYRVDPARSRAEGGTGLGLSIVKHLLESMHGEVSAESALGKGTTIRFRLPAAGSAGEETR